MIQKKLSHRCERVGDQIKRELAQLIKYQVNDPRLSPITISEVQLSKDLSVARVYFSVLDENNVDNVLIAVKKAQGFLRKQLASAMNLRIVPQLNFIYDIDIINAQRLTSLIEAAVAADDQHDRELN